MTQPQPTQVVSWQDFSDFEDSVSTQFDAINAQLAGLKPQTQPDKNLHLWGTADPSAFKGFKTNARRTYSGFEQNPTALLAKTSADAARGAWSYVSIGAGSPNAQTLPPFASTSLDPFIPALAANPNTVFVGIHEPGSKQHPYQPADFVAWMNGALSYAKSKVPGLRTGVCFMAWTGRSSPDDFKQWTPQLSLVDDVCVDGYSHSKTDTPEQLFGNALTYAKSLNRPLTVCEHGQDSTLNNQAAWNQAVFTWAASSPWVKGALYWNSAPYKMSPDALAAFGKLCLDPAVNPIALPL